MLKIVSVCVCVLVISVTYFFHNYSTIFSTIFLLPILIADMNMIAVIFDFFVAGTETTTSTLRYVFIK